MDSRLEIARRVIGPALVSLVLACQAGATKPQAPDGLAIGDSAGVKIVLSAGPTWKAGAGWRVSDSGAVEIGPNGTRPFELSAVTDALLLADGTIVVGNSGSSQLHLFDRSGRYLRSWGRPGAGPGEFRGLGGLTQFGDTIAAIDWGLRRLSRFTPSGGFVGSVTLTIGEEWGPSDRLPNGDWLVLAEGAGIGSAKAGPQRPHLRVGRSSPALDRVDSIMSAPGSEFFVWTGGTGKQAWAIGFPIPFGVHTEVLVSRQGTLLVGNNEESEIQERALDGRLTRIIRWRANPRAVTPADIDYQKQLELERVQASPADRERIEEKFRSAPIPKIKPLFGTFIQDDIGNLWVGRYADRRTDSTRYAVFAPNGQLLGAVAVRPGFTAFRIGPDFLLGLVRSSDDVESVVRLVLRKPVGT